MAAGTQFAPLNITYYKPMMVLYISYQNMNSSIGTKVFKFMDHE